MVSETYHIGNQFANSISARMIRSDASAQRRRLGGRTQPMIAKLTSALLVVSVVSTLLGARGPKCGASGRLRNVDFALRRSKSQWNALVTCNAARHKGDRHPGNHLGSCVCGLLSCVPSPSPCARCSWSCQSLLGLVRIIRSRSHSFPPLRPSVAEDHCWGRKSVSIFLPRCAFLLAH